MSRTSTPTRQSSRPTTQRRVHVAGMTCRSCERRVAKHLLQVPGITAAQVSSRAGTAVLTTDRRVPDAAVAAAVHAAGYRLGRTRWLSVDAAAWTSTAVALAVVGILIVLATVTGVPDLPAIAGDPGSGGLAVVALLGVTAGVSTCMALVGGLVLAVAASAAQAHPDSTGAARMRPHLVFQVGRIAGFAILGAGLGLVGARLSLPPVVQAGLMLAVAVMMTLLGVRLTGLSPRLSGWSPTLPARFAGLANGGGGAYTHRRAAMLGAATFFLPCGFTQAVQLYAMSTGSPARSAVIMTVFAIGTAPGLLALAGLPALATGARRGPVLAFVGVLLIAFAYVNAAGAVRLAGLAPTTAAQVTTTGVSPNVSIADGVQYVTMTQGSRGYSPQTTQVYAGIPTRWVVTGDGASCAAWIRGDDGLNVDAKAGITVVDVPALSPGTHPFSCVMGMYSGALVAIDAPAPTTLGTVPATA